MGRPLSWSQRANVGQYILPPIDASNLGAKYYQEQQAKTQAALSRVVPKKQHGHRVSPDLLRLSNLAYSLRDEGYRAMHIAAVLGMPKRWVHVIVGRGYKGTGLVPVPFELYLHLEMLLDGDLPMPPEPTVLSQDINRKLFDWFASRADARRDVRQALEVPDEDT